MDAAPMPEPPTLRQEDVVAVIRWLDESAAWLRQDRSVAACHGHASQPRVEADLRLYEDAALLFREAYDSRWVPPPGRTRADRAIVLGIRGGPTGVASARAASR